MKIVLSVVAAVIVAAGFSLMSAPEAKAGCVAAYGCQRPRACADAAAHPAAPVAPAACRRRGPLCVAVCGAAGRRCSGALRRAMWGAGPARLLLPESELLRLLQATGLRGRL